MSATVLGRSSPSNLTNQIQPAAQPRYFRDPVLRGEVFARKVQAARCRISGNEFSDGEGDAIASEARDEPGPDGGRCTARLVWVYEGGGDTGEETGDGEGEGEGGQPGEFSFVDLQMDPSSISMISTLK